LAAVAIWMMLRVPPEEAVRQAFAAYKRAVLTNDGSAAAALLSPGSIEWYGHMQDFALHGSKEELEHLGPLEKLQALAFRMRIPAEELRALSPRQLVAYSVSHGWIGKAGTERSELGTMTVADGSATAQLLLDGKDSGQQYHFAKDGGEWQFDQLPTLQSGGEWIATAAQERNMTVDQFVQGLVESGAGKKLTADAWEPPFPRVTPAPAN
ncbi:MAG: hypothetical protein ACRDL7_12665, partial [Gaiellaceae bacterium]